MAVEFPKESKKVRSLSLLCESLCRFYVLGIGLLEAAMIPTPKKSRERLASNRRRFPLPYRPLHLEIDQSLQFDAIFHRKLAHKIIDKAIDRKAHGLPLAEPTLLHIEDLFSTDLAHRSFMLGSVTRASNRDGWVCVGTAAGIDQQSVTLGVVLAALEVFRHVHQAPVSGAALADTDTLGNDVAGSLVGRVHHLCPGILVLPVTGQRNTDYLAT